jgi:RNA polymerase sigma-70 factor, ECF subfamily
VRVEKLRPDNDYDLELIQKSIDGDMDSFKQIVEKYQNKVARVTTSMLGRSYEAEDVGQEVFIRFHNSISKFKGDSNLGTYLVRIAINLCLNSIKKENKFKTSSLSNGNDLSLGGDEETKNDIASLINHALCSLKPEFRSVVVLRNIEGYTTKETAAILEIPQGTVLSRLSRGHDKLREIIIKLEQI